MKKPVKIIALLMAVIMLAAIFAACDKKPANEYFNVVMKVNGVDITAGEYLFYLSEIKESIRSIDPVRAASEYWKLPYGDTGYNNKDFVIKSTKEKAINRVVLDGKFKEYGLKLSKSDLDTMEMLMDSFKMNFDYSDIKKADKLFREELTNSGLTYDVFYSMQSLGAKAQTMINEFYGAGKQYEITQDEIKAYYDENYTRVKHILISYNDSNGKKFTGEALDEAKALADSAYDRAMAGESFEALVTELSEDSGSKSYPDGYIFSANETTFPMNFVEAAFDMEVGEIRFIETVYGYHIVKSYDINETTTLFDIKHDAVYDEMSKLRYYDMFQTWIDEAEVEYFEDELAEINFDYISTTYDTTVTPTQAP